MKKKYNPQDNQIYAQKFWEKNKTFKVKINNKKKKYYCLAMLPYPSGDLHMGHVRNYTISDVISRYQRMLGKNVLQPMGWDAFGLPAEIAAIENKTNPETWTKKNIKKMKKELKSLGFSYDWSRELSTCNPKYFYWEQLFFIKLYKKKLVYKKTAPVNWCKNDNTTLANEQVIKGKCWRCNKKISIKKIPQWFIKITKFAKELLKDIKNLKYWPKEVKSMQKNWIGYKKGTKIVFDIYNSKYKIKVFTKKVEILSKPIFILISPLHKISKKFSKTNIKIKLFIKNKKKKKILINKYAINPINKKKIPIWISKKLDNIYKKAKIKSFKKNIKGTKKNKKKTKNIINKLYKYKKCRKKTIFKIHDWNISRQRLWGTPIPMAKIINTNKIIPIPKKMLPILPFSKKKKQLNGVKIIQEKETFDTFMESSWYHIRYTSPNYKKMIEKKSANYWLPINQYIGGIEHATMHLIYIRFYHKLLFKLKLIDSSEPVIKLLCQGMVLHDAFYYINKKKKKKWIKPSKITIKRNHKGKIIKIHAKKKKIIHAGLIKMSKSKKNGISPKKMIKKYGSDSVRLFIMFAAPPKLSLEWNNKGINGIFKFLKKFWKFIYENYNNGKKTKVKKIKIKKLHKKELKFYINLQKTIKKVTYNIHKTQKFNNSISFLISFVNKMIKSNLCNKKNNSFIRYLILNLIKMFHPFIPHFSFYIWKIFTNKKNIDTETWPKINTKKNKNKKKIIIIQINGKKIEIIKLSKKKTKGEMIIYVIKNKKIKLRLYKKTIKKILYINNKILNFIC